MDPYVVYYPRQNRNLCVSPVNGICSAPDPRWDNFRDNLGYILAILAQAEPRERHAARFALLDRRTASPRRRYVGAEYLVYAPERRNLHGESLRDGRAPGPCRWSGSTLPPATTIAGPSVPAGSTRSFTPPFSGDAVLYLVDSAGHAGSSVPPPASYSVTGLAPGTYRFRVRASDALGNTSSYSNVVAITIPASM